MMTAITVPFRISQMEEQSFLSELMVQDESKIIPLAHGGGMELNTVARL